MLVSAGVVWGVMQSRIKRLEEKISKLESDIATLRTDSNGNRELLVEIKTTMTLLLNGKLYTPKGCKK
jgi:prefoldin subunit 5